MQTYKYDTAPSKGKGKGKESVANIVASSSQHLSIPQRRTMTRPRVSDSTFDLPQNTSAMFQTTGGIPMSNTRSKRPYRMSSTWVSSNADINLISKEEEVDDPRPFVVEYNRLARKVGIPNRSS